MGMSVLILGESGTGKSSSLRNFTEEEVGIINVNGKPLPFKKKLPSVTTDSNVAIKREIKKYVDDGKKVIVVDDAQYVMANEFMRRGLEKGFDKFTEIAVHFWELVTEVTKLPNDVIVYFLSHIERDANGHEKAKTIGKLIDEKITLEGMFSIVLKTTVQDGVYTFVTQNNGSDTVKSPMDMFDSYAIDNDLKYVDDKIRNYYVMDGAKSDTEIKKADDTAKVESVTKDSGKKKRGKKVEEVKKEEQSEAPTEEAKAEADTDTAEAETVMPKPTRKKRTTDNEENVDFFSDEAKKIAEETAEELTQEAPKRRRRRVTTD